MFCAHEYDQIEEHQLFKIVSNDLPPLHKAATEALRQWELFKLP